MADTTVGVRQLMVWNTNVSSSRRLLGRRREGIRKRGLLGAVADAAVA